jgi:hypothetical protein
MFIPKFNKILTSYWQKNICIHFVPLITTSSNTCYVAMYQCFVMTMFQQTAMLISVQT